MRSDRTDGDVGINIACVTIGPALPLVYISLASPTVQKMLLLSCFYLTGEYQLQE